ncbi:hypothetical protein FNV43_RR01770 [Rhamnella rubrinervis]|uniref:N-acetyltransferase domain-containing protein n=1 Tax=Rhamnella rubrinervis TaxID=2594499 RepID=A0A8K0HS31_9ROSA|nr:hypothetical protein FNV43_RR01770 [Rhamnella rubrinervis]
MPTKLKVRDLKKIEEDEWDEEKLQTLFVADTIKAILRIKWPKVTCNDKLIWIGNKTSIFSVKESYLASFCGEFELNSNGFREKLWKASLHERLKIFLWRMTVGIISVNQVIFNRTERKNLDCPLCGSSLLIDNGGRNRSGGDLSVFLASPDARVIGGGVGGIPVRHMEITLRPYQLSDVEDFMDWCDDKVVALSWLSHYSTKQEAATYIKEVAMPHPWYRAICLDGRPVGFVGFAPGSGDYRCKGSISYALGSKFWGQGITTRAVKMAIPCVFKEFPDIERLEGFADVDNIASQKVLEKAGFLKEGVFKKYIIFKGRVADVVMHSILRNHE